jgi:hypothetical protein
MSNYTIAVARQRLRRHERNNCTVGATAFSVLYELKCYN